MQTVQSTCRRTRRVFVDDTVVGEILQIYACPCPTARDVVGASPSGWRKFNDREVLVDSPYMESGSQVDHQSLAVHFGDEHGTIFLAVDSVGYVTQDMCPGSFQVGMPNFFTLMIEVQRAQYRYRPAQRCAGLCVRRLRGGYGT